MFVFNNFCSLKPESVKAKFPACIMRLNTCVCVYGQGLSLQSPLPAVPYASAAIAVLDWMQGETTFHTHVQFGLGCSNTQSLAVVMLWEVDLVPL